MPGPVSDSFDVEFGTGANADEVRNAIKSIVDMVDERLGPELKYIVEVVYAGPKGKKFKITLTENQLRVIRFGLLRALDSI